MRDEAAVNRALELYSDTVRRICFIHLKSHADVEDVFQDVFLKYILYERVFENDAHEKAWFIRVAINSCKDLLKSFFRKKLCSLEDVDASLLSMRESDLDLLDCILRLNPKYRNVIYLSYYEGYTAEEISQIIGRNKNTVYTWLNRARKELKLQLEGDPNG